MDVLIMVRALSCAVKINRAVDLTSCSSLTPYLFFPRRAHKLGSLDLRSPILYLCMSSELESVTICIWDQNRIDVQDRTSMFHVGVHSLHSLIDSTSHFSRFCGNGIAMRQTQYCTAIHDTSSMIHPSLYPTNISNSEFQLSSPIVIKLPQSLHRYHGLTMLSTSLQLYCQSLTPLISYHVADVGVCLSRLGGERMCCHLL